MSIVCFADYPLSAIFGFVLTVNFGNSTVLNKNQYGKLKHTISHVTVNHGAVTNVVIGCVSNVCHCDCV